MFHRRLILAAVGSAALLFALAGVTAANTGSVSASETCSTWSVTVTLNHNVTSDRTVVVVTTIPGTTGIAGNHYNTSFGQIWSASGAAPATGTVDVEDPRRVHRRVHEQCEHRAGEGLRDADAVRQRQRRRRRRRLATPTPTLTPTSTRNPQADPNPVPVIPG